MESCVFAPVVSQEEWQLVPAEIGKKISKFVNEKFEEFITSKALLETKSFNSEKSHIELQEQNEAISSENEALKARLEAANASITELDSQVSNLSAELVRLQCRSNQLESETAEFRHQRNLAIDERDEHLKMMQRRNSEIERMQMDLNTLTKQLEDAVKTKCEALAQADEVASMKVTLDHREKRLEQERALRESQIESLMEELQQRTDELLNMRRDGTSRCIQLETKLSEKTQELTVANEQLKSFTELNKNLSTRNEELAQKIFNLNETHAKVNESYVCEIEAKTKMADAYKKMYEESQQHAQELREALNEVQELLKQATEQYGDLETKYKEMELMHAEILEKKNDCIAMLKKELETANELIENSKRDVLGRDIEDLSPSASRIKNTSMTYTELYSRYASAKEQLTNKEDECTRLNNYILCIVKEIEEKGPLIKRLRQEYSETLDANDALKASNDSLVAELQQLREANAENRRMEGKVARENERMKKEIADLSRQVVHLLQEVEHSRVGSSSTSTDNDLSDSVSSADIITKRLVTFNDIHELQGTNQKLLALVRELTERQEEAENFDPAAVAELQRKLEELRESQQELLEERDQQNKLMVTLRNQRDLYRNLYEQAKPGNEDVSMEVTGGGGDVSKAQSDADYDDKIHDLEAQIDKYKKQIDQLKEEYETYRKDRSDNEKIMLEQLESVRNEAKELTRINCKLTSQAELNEEKFKVLNNNVEIYKKQIGALEKQNKIYSEAVIKHEQAATYLKDEALQCQAKLSKAEVMLGNLEKENALLKDAERRLSKECEMLRKHGQQQYLLQSNIELIKATLERNDAESKLRLEAKLDEAHLECSSLRRRLEEEQNHFRELSKDLEQQTKRAQERMEEEKKEADKLRKELAEAREELVNKTNHIDDLSKKLKSSVFHVPDATVEGRKLREMEQQVANARAEINALKTKLKTAKEASEEYLDVAQNAEKQLKEVLEQKQQDLEEIDRQKQLVRELQEKCAELQGELSIQLDDQDMANASIRENKSKKLQEELDVRTMDLHTAREQLENAKSDIKNLGEQLKAAENKYAREVTLHSADLQSLTDLKEELDRAIDHIRIIEGERDRAVDALNQNLESNQEQQRILEEEKTKLEERFKSMEEQNAVLHDQIQQINSQLTILQAQSSADTSVNQSMESSFNRSFAEDEMHSSEQLLKIIKYLRQEKDIAVSKADIIEAEHIRLKSQFDAVRKQLEEAKAQVEMERQNREVAVVSGAKHAEVLRKLETLNAITDSNRALRQERDQLLAEANEFRTRAEKLEIDVAPLQEKNRDLQSKAEQLQAENISLRGECARWRQRANQLIEKSNRTSPEDWKKLQTERETLAKQLTVERGNNAKLADENNNLKLNLTKLEEQLKAVRAQSNVQNEEISKLREQVSTLQAQVTQLKDTLEQQVQSNNKMVDENRILTEETAAKDVTITELKNNLAQVKKIAKKYKMQYEDQAKDMESLRQQNEQTQSEQNVNAEKQNLLIEQQRTEHEEKVNRLENTHKEALDQLNQQVNNGQEQIDTLKKDIESLKHASQEKEEKFKTLFKNAKERIVSLTEQNASLREELNRQRSGDGQDGDKIIALQQEREELLEKLAQEKDGHAAEIEALSQRINQLERKLGQQQQQGSKPSTSSASIDTKSSTERPTADIKPMAGHSTNTQTQSVPIQPWRSGGEPPLASIRPMSQQLRTAAVLPTTQQSSSVAAAASAMVPPQQQVHTTGSSTSVEVLSSSSPTSSHTDYVPATSSASSGSGGAAGVGPRQVAVPPTQSSEDDEASMQVQPAPQQQALAVVSPRVEPPSTQEQGTSSSGGSSNAVTTTQQAAGAGLKRQRDADTDSVGGGQAEEKQSKAQMQLQQQSKRTRLLVQHAAASDSGVEVEYQVPTSSQRDHDDDNVIVVESDDDAAPDEGDGDDDDDDQEEPDDTEVYDDLEGMEQDNYEDADCQDVEDEEGGNEVEVIEDSDEVPNRASDEEDRGERQAQSEAISSGTDASRSLSGGVVTISQASTSSTVAAATASPFSRSRPVPPLPPFRQPPMSALPGLLDEGDDGIVPSTPTLFAPRRSDGFGEAVRSPHVPYSATGRFTFSESPRGAVNANPGPQEPLLEVPQADDNSTGRSVPTTPLQSSPQESIPNVAEEQADRPSGHSDAEIPQIMISSEEPREGSSEELMGPPGQAGTSSEETQSGERVDDIEGDDEVSSEGEKQPATEGGEEEGREAEASSPSSNSRSRSGVRGVATSARRSTRLTPSRGNRQGPTPIVWGDQRQSPQRHHDRLRGGVQGFSTRVAARRGRGRIQRPFGGRF